MNKDNIMHKKIIFSLLCTTVLATPSFAGIKEGIELFNAGKYEPAFTEFSYLADEGDNLAAYYLGQQYLNGWGVPQSYEKAAQYYLKSYTQGNPKAAAQLGALLASGSGVQQDLPKGLELLKTAARAGDEQALFQLGELYAKGEVVPKEYVYAGGYYKLAALQGYAPAQFKLGLLYLYGRGLPQDYELALKWLGRAANQGYVDAQHDLAELFADKSKKLLYNPQDAHTWYNIIAAYNTNDVGAWAASKRDAIAGAIRDSKTLEIAQERARNWRPISAKDSVPEVELTAELPIIPEFNDANTLRSLQEQNVLILSDGTAYGIRTDELETAIATNQTLALEQKITEQGEKGKPDAFTYWAKIVEGRLHKPQEAVAWYTKGADANDAEAQYKMAQLYCEGKLVTLSPSTCYMWLQLAVQNASSPLKETVQKVMTSIDVQIKPEDKAAGKKMADERQRSTKKAKKTDFSLF